MPAILTHDCPYCSTASVGFEMVRSVSNPLRKGWWTVFFVCPSCTGGLTGAIYDLGIGDPMKHPGNLGRPGPLSNTVLLVKNVQPERVQMDTPEHLPEGVAKAFTEGAAILKSSPNASATMFRRALELGLKALAPDVEAWKLEKRIDKLAEMHLLTPAIHDWAHQLRLDGNEAVHGVEDVSREEAEQIQSLTRYVLTYLYTLPKQVEAARAPKSQAPAA